MTLGCFCKKKEVVSFAPGSISQSATHMGLDLAASDSRTKIMVTLTETPLFSSHITSRASVAVS